MGKTSSYADTAGIQLEQVGTVKAIKSGGVSLYLDRLSIRRRHCCYFRKDNTIVGSIGTSGGDSQQIGTGITTLKYVDALNTIHPNGTGSMVQMA